MSHLPEVSLEKMPLSCVNERLHLLAITGDFWGWEVFGLFIGFLANFFGLAASGDSGMILAAAMGSEVVLN